MKTVLCDVCGKTARYTDVDLVVLYDRFSGDRDPQWTLDFCEEHYKEMCRVIGASLKWVGEGDPPHA